MLGTLRSCFSPAADVDGALALLQWVLSAKPDATAAEQQLQAALKLVGVLMASPAATAAAQAGGVLVAAWAHTPLHTAPERRQMQSIRNVSSILMGVSRRLT